MSDADKPLLVKGDVVFEENTKSFHNATVYIKLLDVGKQDVESKVVSTQILNNVSFDQEKDKKISFSLRGNITKSHFATYVVSVLVDLDGDKETSLGDYITMTNYQVLPPLTSPTTILVKKVY